jgi:hypothetical protein
MGMVLVSTARARSSRAFEDMKAGDAIGFVILI